MTTEANNTDRIKDAKRITNLVLAFLRSMDPRLVEDGQEGVRRSFVTWSWDRCDAWTRDMAWPMVRDSLGF